MREIILDTETTGLDPLNGDRIVELGCVELMNLVPTGRNFQAYINPERAMPSAASDVHGLTDAFLAKQPVFAEIAGDFLEFIGETPLVIHNAPFDMGFVNAELSRHGFAPIPPARATDTLALARRMFPGAPASLDALCKRFGVDASGRDVHGALLDARLLADVYLELRGGRQTGLVLAAAVGVGETASTDMRPREFRAPRDHAPTEDEIAAHEAFLGDIKEALWKRA